MVENTKRVSNYAKDNAFEKVLKQLNRCLASEEEDLIRSFKHPKLPTVFIIGAQRSGSTLLLQLLLKFAHFGYINNLISRFWEAPYIGTLISNSLRKKDYIDNINFQSDLGYTLGCDGPHEFGYFWRKWFPEATFEGRGPEDKTSLVKTFAALEHEWRAPVLIKNLISCSFHISQLAELFPKSIFLHIAREPFFSAQSTYLSRIRLFGKPDAWFGLKPPEYPKLKKVSSPWVQIAGQLFYTQKHIEKALEPLPANRKMCIAYETLCRQPKEMLNKINELILRAGSDLRLSDWLPQPLQSRNKISLHSSEITALKDALDRYFGPSRLITQKSSKT